MRKDVRYQKIEGMAGYFRDPSNGAILNTNAEQIVQAQRVKKERLKKEKEYQDLKNDVDELKSDIQDIKLLLERLAEI